MKIAICPGHTKERQGAFNFKHNISEHTVALKVVQILKNMMTGHNVDIIIGSLSHKVKQINSGNYDLALDIHFNADAETIDNDDKRGYGCMVMYYPTSMTRRKQADKMSAAISAVLETKDRGGRKAWYWGGSNPGTKADYFTDKTNCPAFIPEPGYIDNNKFTDDFLLDNSGHIEIAKALKAGIESFRG